MSNQTPLPLVGVNCCAPLVSESLTASEAADLARVLKALGDPVRLRLLSMIGAHEGGETCVCELTDAFDVTAPTISHHLRVLREAGLIACERRGTWVYYWIVPETMTRLARLFAPEPARVSSQ